jgi:anti-anti-sigma factor
MEFGQAPGFRYIKIESVSSEMVHLAVGHRIVAGDSSEQARGALESCCDLFKVRAFALRMADVTQIDAAGIGALVAGYRAASRVGATFRLIDVPPRISELLVLCRLDGMFGLPPASTGGVE